MRSHALPLRRLLCGLTAGLVALPIAAAAQSAAAPEPRLRIGGSSTLFPILERAISEFRQASAANRRAAIELTESGTSAGMRAFCDGRLEIANASRPISAKELKACGRKGITFIELPLAFDAITVVVNPGNTWAQMITTRELSRAFNRQAEGRIKRWNQVNIDWPERPLKICAPGADSGTFDTFNKAISGDSNNARRDVFSSEDDNELVKCVAGDRNAIGYFGFSYYAANRQRLRALSIVGPKGAVAPSLASVQRETYLPLSRPLFLYVNDGSLRRNELARRFLTWTVRNGLRLTEQTGFIPLPSTTYQLVEAKLYRHVLGSAFAGELPVGQNLGDTLRRSLESVRRPQPR